MAFNKIKVPSAAEIVAIKIKKEILKGSYPVNSKLPPERELAQMLGVGRSTVREALQMLKMMGLITVKGGSRGGAFVKETNVSSLIPIIELMFELDVTSWKEIIELRLAIEPFTNKLASLYRSEEDLKSIRKILDDSQDAFDDHEKYAAFNTMFHLKLAECSHNKLLTSFVSVITEFISHNGYEIMKSPILREHVYNQHYEILLAIEKQDGDRAYKLTEHHLREALEKYEGQKMKQKH